MQKPDGFRRAIADMGPFTAAAPLLWMSAMENETRPVAEPRDYTDKALPDQRRTYDRMIGMFKWLIIAVAFILLGLLVFFR